MPGLIVKPDKDENFYIVWSQVVDNITAAGTRAELQTRPATWPDTYADERFDRADTYGSSARPDGEMAGEGYWNDKGFVVTNEDRRDDGPFFWLERDDLRAYARGDVSVLRPLPH